MKTVRQECQTLLNQFEYQKINDFNFLNIKNLVLTKVDYFLLKFRAILDFAIFTLKLA